MSERPSRAEGTEHTGGGRGRESSGAGRGGRCRLPAPEPPRPSLAGNALRLLGCRSHSADGTPGPGQATPVPSSSRDRIQVQPGGRAWALGLRSLYLSHGAGRQEPVWAMGKLGAGGPGHTLPVPRRLGDHCLVGGPLDARRRQEREQDTTALGQDLTWSRDRNHLSPELPIPELPRKQAPHSARDRHRGPSSPRAAGQERERRGEHAPAPQALSRGGRGQRGGLTSLTYNLPCMPSSLLGRWPSSGIGTGAGTSSPRHGVRRRTPAGGVPMAAGAPAGGSRPRL